jgi:ATP-dependent DNA helicase RecG
MNKGHKTPLRRLLAEGESEAVEFKESLDEEAVETVAAFSNTKGGTLLIGVADDGTVKGVTLGKVSIAARCLPPVVA